MPLNPTQLRQDLNKILSDVNQKPPQIASALANAYQNYALTGEFQPGFLPFLPTNVALLQQSLLAAIQIPAGNPVLFAQAWSTGLTAYWLTPPVVITGGTVLGVPGVLAATPLLTTLFANIQATVPSTASGLASILDTVSRTVAGLVSPSISVVLV